jgi:hypothetical protein
MKSTFSCAFGVVAVLGVGMAAFAQTTGQTPAQPQPRTQAGRRQQVKRLPWWAASSVKRTTARRTTSAEVAS